MGVVSQSPERRQQKARRAENAAGPNCTVMGVGSQTAEFTLPGQAYTQLTTGNSQFAAPGVQSALGVLS